MTQKIVVNHCYGGFGLSKEAIRKLYELGDKHITVTTRRAYFGKDRKDYKEDDYKEHGSWSKMTRREYEDQDLDFVGVPALGDEQLLIDNHEYEDRDCPLLVKVVKEMKSAVNGTYANLEVVEIPNGVKWVIDEYDGSESVEEAHRSW